MRMRWRSIQRKGRGAWQPASVRTGASHPDWPMDVNAEGPAREDLPQPVAPIPMMPLPYLFARVFRRAMPGWVTRRMLESRVFLVPGTETTRPEFAAERYAGLLHAAGRSLEGSRVFVLGYGGYFGLGVELVRRGARHVVLCDPYAKEDSAANRRLAKAGGPAIKLEDGRPVLEPDRISVFRGTASAYARTGPIPPDLVLSSSVCEHLRDAGGMMATLRDLMRRDGLQVHIVDMRDHFFRYPFEMYCHSDGIWRRFFDPPSHHNRIRPWTWEAMFREHFRDVRVDVLEADRVAFQQAEPRIRPEFLSGDVGQDAACKIAVSASGPGWRR